MFPAIFSPTSSDPEVVACGDPEVVATLKVPELFTCAVCAACAA